MIEIKVTNKSPKVVSPESVDSHLLSAFRSVLPIDVRDVASPFEHQAAGWRKIVQDEEVGLIAGTAAGKTLAAAVPLFDKLFRQKSIQKALFLYPTIALLEDQYDTLRKLLKHFIDTTGAKPNSIGRIRGGLTSSHLLQALSKPIIVATPDSVYWFFRKNIKYNAFLIYGLLQADEVVVDEAHLFTGLMLRNAQHLLDRMRFLKKEYLDKSLKVHYLTATSSDDTKQLSVQAKQITGQSKCGDVDLVITEKMPVWERQETMADLTRDLLAQGKQHILVVCNSARRAHQLFDTLRDNRKSSTAPELPTVFWKTFGLVEIEPALQQLEILDSETVKVVEGKIQENIALSKKDLQKFQIKLQPDYCAAQSSEWLEMKHREIRQATYRYAREAEDRFNGEDLQGYVDNHCRETRKMLGLRLQGMADLEEALVYLDHQLGQVGQWLEENWGRFGSDPGHVELSELSIPGFQSLIHNFDERPEGITKDLDDDLGRYLSRNLTLDSQSVANLAELGLTPYKYRKINIQRLLAWVEDEILRQEWEMQLLTNTKPHHSAVGLLRDDPNKAVIILYSGSMARYAREGLIDLFQHPDLNRPVALIATSAVEVGVDFAADALITEECPASGFLQRFGRVGRRENLQSLVHVLVSGDTYQGLNRHLTGKTTITRDEFSTLLTTVPECGFQEREYITASTYADAAQQIISQQVGQVGQRYVAQQSPDPEVDELVNQLRQNDIDPAYGLRGTLPGVALADSGVSKDPFYILNYVTNEDIESVNSPFEVARIQRYFNELIYKSWQRTVIVDIDTTLKRNQLTVVPEQDFIRAGKQGKSPAEIYQDVRKLYLDRPPDRRGLLLERVHQLPASTLDAPHLLLGYGDIYLSAIDKETRLSDPVQTYDQERLRLRNQWYLVLLGYDVERAKQILGQIDATAFENEIYYDFAGVEEGVNPVGVVLTERQTGAIWEIWQRLRKVDRQ